MFDNVKGESWELVRKGALSEKIPEVFNCEWYLGIYRVVHGKDGRKIQSHAANTGTIEKLTNPFGFAVSVACRWCGIVSFGLEEVDEVLGHRSAQCGATFWRRREQRGRVDGSSLFGWLLINAPGISGATVGWNLFLVSERGVMASSGPRTLILVGSLLRLLSVRGVSRSSPLSNGSRPKSILIPAASRCSFSLRERFRACSLA